jgi:hypothetical protein
VAFVYGGSNDKEALASVEQLLSDGSAWQTLPTPMFAAEFLFASVSLPIVVSTTTTAATKTTTTTY